MKVGIEIIYKDGEKDWVDPVDEDLFEEITTPIDGYYSIYNGHGIYKYKANEVKEISIYQLYECCGFDARYEHHSSKCEHQEGYDE